MSPPLKILIFSMDGAGHLNACVGMAQALAKRGHRIQFLLNRAFKGQFGKFGFEELYLIKSETQDIVDQPNPIKQTAMNLIGSVGYLSGKSPLEKLKDQVAGPVPEFMFKMSETLVEFNPQIEEIIRKEAPHLVIVDHLLIPPAIPMCGLPWINLFSGNPMTLYGSEKLPPFGAGFATDSDPSSWQEYKELRAKRFASTYGGFQAELNSRFHYTPPEVHQHTEDVISPYLNIYGYPQELDYHDIVPIPVGFARVDAFIRDDVDSAVETFEFPVEFATSKNKLIYVSLGSMGSVDVDLMKRITSVLAKSPHMFIISKGPRADEYELPPNCWGEAFLPQTQFLPLVDLVITHGGNNTITETFSMGKPMIVLPLFADQYDNAQRVEEKGFGARLETYAFTDQELLDTIERLLNDGDLGERAQQAAKRISEANSKVEVCKRIEQIATLNSN